MFNIYSQRSLFFQQLMKSIFIYKYNSWYRDDGNQFIYYSVVTYVRTRGKTQTRRQQMYKSDMKKLSDKEM